MDDILTQIRDGIYRGKTDYVIDRTELALKYGISTEEIIKEAMLPPMKQLGEELRSGKIFIPEVLKASRAMHAAIYVLKPLISHYNGGLRATVVIGTVAGDLHDIGKNMVVMFLRGSGFNVIDLGIDVPKEEFAKAIQQYKPEVLAMSALLTTTMPEIKNVIDYLKKIGLRDQVKITVGGMPVTAKYAHEAGADAYSSNMFEAAEAVDDLVHNRIGKYSV
jgi:methylmalonyl-CoA mutase cobalamin-binding domain/chain